MNIASIISLIFSALCNFKASKTFKKDKSNFCHRNLLMQINIIFLCPCSDMGAGKYSVRSLVPRCSRVKVRLFRYYNIWNIWKIFCSVWYLDGISVRCFLKYLEQIFQLALISVEGTVNAFNDGDGIWSFCLPLDCKFVWWHLERSRLALQM